MITSEWFPNICHPTNSIPAQHWKTSSYGLQTLTEPFWSRDSQWIYKKDEDDNWRSEVCNPQNTGLYKKILQPTKNSSSSVQTQWQSLPWRIGYLDYVPLTETLALMAWPLCSGMADRTYGLLLKAATLDEATPSSVQCSEAYSSSRWPDYRMENGRSPTAHSHQQRSRVGGRRDTWHSLAPKKIPVSHQVERVWSWTQLLGICFQSFCTSVTNFIWPYLHQFFDNSHGLNSDRKPLKRPFNQYQSRLKVISIGQDIRQINW